MVSYNSILGLPVMVKETNNKIAKVKDILYSCDEKTVMGIIVEQKNVFGSLKYIPLNEIAEIQKTLILVNSPNCIKELNENDNMYNKLINSNKCAINSNVYFKNGKKIGKINDIIFNFELGTIDSYVISNGVIEDLISGRKVLNDKKITHKKNNAYISD